SISLDAAETVSLINGKKASAASMKGKSHFDFIESSLSCQRTYLAVSPLCADRSTHRRASASALSLCRAYSTRLIPHALHTSTSPLLSVTLFRGLLLIW